MQVMYGEISSGTKNDVEVIKPTVDYNTFDALWVNIFPYVRIRVYKSVTGKCWTCHEINRIRRESRDSKVLLAAKRLHQLHRGGMFQLERKRLKTIICFIQNICFNLIHTNYIIISYKKRVHKASLPENLHSIMSIILDGMDTQHCNIPLMGQDVAFEHQLNQHITGALMHGHKSKFYKYS
jgi:hypothetical protein